MSYQDIEFEEVNNVRVDELNKDISRITLNVKLENPNPYKIKVVNSDLNLFIGGKDAGKAELKDKIVLKKKAIADYDIVIDVDNKEFSKALVAAGLNMLFTGSVQVKVKGTIKGRVFIFGKKVDVEFKQSVKMDQLKKK